MQPPTLDDLPPPPGKTGWPWTDTVPTLSTLMADGKPWPKISVITPSYNQAEFLEETIRSVLLQGYPNLEYIIIDGGSKDGSQQIIQRYEGYLAYWESTRDRGQSHALNKGFSHATGEVMGWLNSDDLLTPGALATVGRAWHDHKGKLIAGSVIWFEHKSGAEEVREQIGLEFEHAVRFWTRLSRHRQPGIFFPRTLFHTIGGIDETLRFSMDYDLFCRLLRETDVVLVDRPLARFRYHAHSKTGSNGDAFVLEAYNVSRRYWNDLPTPVDEAVVNAFMAQQLARSAIRRLRTRRIGRAATLFSQALKFNTMAALAAPFTLTIAHARRRKLPL